MFVVSPICGSFGQIQSFNYHKKKLDDVEGELREGMQHLKFAMSLCKFQCDRVRLLTFEHPSIAKPWITGTGTVK